MSESTVTKRSAALVRDRVENFHGQQLVYIGWDHHMMICAPIALLLDPKLEFSALLAEHLPHTAFALHPEWTRIDWSGVQWFLSDRPLTPRPNQPLIEQGIGHKAFLRFRTPELRGIAGTGA